MRTPARHHGMCGVQVPLTGDAKHGHGVKVALLVFLQL